MSRIRILLTVCGLMALAVSVSAQPQPGSPWPMMHHDQYHTGRSPYDGPKTAALKWAFETGSRMAASPAIAADGTIYIPSYDGHLYAVNPDGTEKWRFFLSLGAILSSPAIGLDGTVYILRPEGFCAVYPDGTLRWETDILWGNILGPVIGADGTIYVGDRKCHLFAFNPDGRLQWVADLPSPDARYFWAAPSVGPDGTIYIGSDWWLGSLFAVNHDGSLKWQFGGFGLWNCLGPTSFSVEDSTLYAGAHQESDTLYALSPDGTVKWRFPSGGHIRATPSIGMNGTVYFGLSDDMGRFGGFYALCPDGSLKWSFRLTVGVFSSAAIDSDGTIYFGTTSTPGNVYALNPDGTLLWSYTLPTDIRSSPAIGADGTVYVGCYNGTLYALEEATSIEEKERLHTYRYELRQNRPNPFVSSGGTVIRYGIARPGQVSLKVYDVSGRLVQTLVQEKKKAGYYAVTWDGKDSRNQEVASGVYFYKIQAGDFGDVKKTVLLR